MKAILISCALALFGSNALAAYSYDKVAGEFLTFFNTSLGKDESIVLKGRNCEVTIYNRSKLNPNFPAASLSAQTIQVSVREGDDTATAQFRRAGEIRFVEYRLGSRPGMNIRVITPTGVGATKRAQSLGVFVSGVAPKELTITAAGFDNKTRTCVAQMGR